MAKGITQFVGAPCGHHGPYTFYKAFKYFKHGKYKILTLGEFFFARISPHDDPCIGELQLLWEDSNSEQVLSSTRLYFLPEQTPEGRRSQHGEHEVVAAAEKVILRLSDLVSWITEEVEWTHGLIARCEEDIPPADAKPSVVPVGGPGSATLELSEGVDWVQVFRDSHYSLDVNDVKKEKELIGTDSQPPNGEGSSVLVMSYPRYCRFRGILKRVYGMEDKWLRNALVAALGGFALTTRNTRILFCRDTFEHDGLAQHDLNCEHLAPNLKGRPRKKRAKANRSHSPGAESNTSDESKEIISNAKLLKNGLNKPECKDEQEFLQKLFKFMQERETPIQRVPHLGFKQINLYFFYTFAQKLGGYDKVTGKKLWKHIYDELGGNPGSTSAATCTRRHYERLLLPFERHMNGQDSKPLPSSQNKSRHRKKKENNDKESSGGKDSSSGNEATKDENGTNATPTEDSKPPSNFEDEDDKEDDEDDEDDVEEDVFTQPQEEPKEEEPKKEPEPVKETKMTELEKQEMEWEARRRKHSQQKQVRPSKPIPISHSGGSPKPQADPVVSSCVTPRTPLSAELPTALPQTPVSQEVTPSTKDVSHPIIRQEYEQLSNSSNEDPKSPQNRESPCSVQEGEKGSRSSPIKDVPPITTNTPTTHDFALQKPSAPICFSAAVPFPYAASPLLSMSAHMANLPTNSQHSTFPINHDIKPSMHSLKDAMVVPKTEQENQEVKARLAPSIMAPLFYRKSETGHAQTPQIAHKNHVTVKSEPLDSHCRLLEVSRFPSPETPMSAQRRPSVILHTEQMRTPPPSHSHSSPQMFNTSLDSLHQKMPIAPAWQMPANSNRVQSKNYPFSICDMSLKQLTNKLSAQCEAPSVAIMKTREGLTHSLHHDSIKRQLSVAANSSTNNCLYPEVQRTVQKMAGSFIPKEVGSDHHKWNRGPQHAHPKRPKLSVTTPYTVNAIAKSSPPNHLPTTRPMPYNQQMPSTSFARQNQDEVLDLSLKKTMQEADSRSSPQDLSTRAPPPSPVAECLDLSIKKKPPPPPPSLVENLRTDPHKLNSSHTSKHIGNTSLFHPKSHPILPSQLNNTPKESSVNNRGKLDTYALQNQVLGMAADAKSRHFFDPSMHLYPNLHAAKSRTDSLVDFHPQIPPVVAPSVYAVPGLWAAAQSAHSPFLNVDVQSSISAYQKLMDQRVFAGHYPYHISPHLAPPARHKDDSSYKRFSK